MATERQLTQAKRLQSETGVSLAMCLLVMRVYKWDFRRAKAEVIRAANPTTRMLYEVLDRIEVLEERIKALAEGGG